LHLIFVHYISQQCELYLYISRKLTMLHKQLYQYASKHQVSNRKQWASMCKQVPIQPVYAQIGFLVK
jgi:hypothetical protein